MTENYVDKYKAEDSESSIIDDEDSKLEQAPKADSHPVSSFKPENIDRSDKYQPYTFNAKEVLKESNKSDIPEDYNPKRNMDFSNPKLMNNQMAYGNKDLYSSQFANLMSQRQMDITSLTALGDIEQCRMTDDYKGFAQEFDRDFTSDQKEMEQVSKDLMVRTQKLDVFKGELENADLDMILFRNRLVREIEDVQNDFREAYNNILVLMGDRANMRDQFCLFKMKLKKLKGFIKTFQDDVQTYFLTYI